MTDAATKAAAARMMLVRALQDVMQQGLSLHRAALAVHEQIASGDVALAQAAAACKTTKLQAPVSVRQLERWFDAYAQGGFDALAPESRSLRCDPPWLPQLLKHYGKPTKPTLQMALDDLKAAWASPGEPPSYWVARRALLALPLQEREAGRMGKVEMANHLAFVRRSTDDLLPGDVGVADGHCFDAETMHPHHGKAFRPEITTIADAATRVIAGISLSLSESTIATLDALYMAATGPVGVFSILYMDNGPGYKNLILKEESTGVLARLGTTATHSIPRNAKAHGLIERMHGSLWVKEAMRLPTYIGARMDPEAKQKVFALTRKHLRENGESRLLMSFDDFMAAAMKAVEQHNNRPHRSLPRYRDGNSWRHMTPMEALQSHRDKGWTPTQIDPTTMRDAMWPAVTRKVIRGEIRLGTKIYFAPQLSGQDGEVLVSFNMRDPSEVVVRSPSGAPLCVAQLNGNRTPYFPKSFVDEARDRRELTAARRLEQKLELIRSAPEPAALTDTEIEQARAASERLALTPPPAADQAQVYTLSSGRPVFDTDAQMYRWLMRHPADITARDRAWLDEYVDSDDYAALVEIFIREGLQYEPPQSQAGT